MSKGRRGGGRHKGNAHARHRGRVTLRGVDPWHAVMYAACAGADDLEAAKQQVHDALVDRLGDHRTGGVTWRVYPSIDAPPILDDLQNRERVGTTSEAYSADPSAGVVAYLEQLRRRLADWPDGYLVIASAPAERTP